MCYLDNLLTHVGVSDTLSYHHVDNSHYYLDQLLAAQGSVCHILGEVCCTYISGISDNAHVVPM